MRPPLILYFLHLHKHGGTSFCKIAKRQVYDTYWKSNCNVPFAWTSATPQTSPYFGATKKAGAVVRQKLINDGREFAASEGVLESWFPAKEWYTYVTMLRDPTAAMISGYGYGKRLHKHQCATFTKWLQLGILANTSRDDGCSGKAQRLWQNPITQRLCGDGCHVPPGRKSLGVAKANLAQFDLVMFLDTFDDGLEHLGILRAKWRNVTAVVANAPKISAMDHTAADLDREALVLVQKVSSLDQELYQWAKANCRQGRCI
jgi:hypothetical protein